MYTSCTCIRAWLLHALSKQSCKAIARERVYSDSILHYRCYTFAWPVSLERSARAHFYARLSLRTRRLLKVTKSQKCSLETRPSPSSAIIITLTFEPYRSYGAEGDDFRKFAHVICGTIVIMTLNCNSACC